MPLQSNTMPSDAQTLSETGTKTTKGLSFLLSFVMGLLCIVFIFMIAIAIIVLVPSGLRESLLTEYAASEGAVLKTSSLAAACLSGALVVGAYILVVRILSKIVRTLRAGDPFVPENISRLRNIWMIIAGAELFRMAAKLFFSAAPNSPVSGDAMTFDIRVITWFLVFIIAALAEVFRHGAELRRDQEFTI